MNNPPGIWQLFLLVGWLALAGCRASAETPPASTETLPASTETPPAPAEALRVSCTPLTGDGGEVVVRVIIENVSDSTLHIFDSRRMPYLLEQDGDLVILYGVNPPDPNMDYFMIEIPATKILPPGEQVEIQVGLTPLRLGDHYGLPRERNPAVTKHGAVIVHCEVGWGRTPILPAPEEQNVLNIYHLIEWQQLSRAEPVRVQFP